MRVGEDAQFRIFTCIASVEPAYEQSMNHLFRTSIVVGGIALAIGIAWNGATVTSDAPLAADAAKVAQPVRRVPDAAVGMPMAVPESLIVARTASETDGMTIAAFIAAMEPRARLGDADAAFKLYSVERRCDRAERLKTDLEKYDEETRSKIESSIAMETAACAGVTPAQVRERMVFLDQAIRAGLPNAMLMYRYEGPDGVALESLPVDDPRISAWKQTAHGYLETLAAAGDRRAWSQLSADYQHGAIGPREPATAIAYAVAGLSGLDLNLDPRANAIVTELSPELSANDLEAAIARGHALGARFPPKPARP